MLDVIAAFAFGAMVAGNVIVLASLAAVPLRSKIIASAAAMAWVAAVVAVAAFGGFRPGLLGAVPVPVLAFSALVLGSMVAWRAWPAFRNAWLSIPIGALVGVNALRVGGVFFLLLFAEGRLPAPFAPAAGWGDIITGVAAIPVAALGAARPDAASRLVAAWNAFGALDLLVAVTLAFLSAPGTPYRVYTDGPGTVVMTTVPWILAATFLVPLYLLTHVTIATRLRLARVASQPHLETSDAPWRTA
jgi:hypothetical protein